MTIKVFAMQIGIFMGIKEFLIKEYEKNIKKQEAINHIDENYESYWSDYALLSLLKEYKDYLPELNYYFHKAFRQCDITPSGKIDSAIYCLLHASKIFWQTFDEVLNENKKEKKL